MARSLSLYTGMLLCGMMIVTTGVELHARALLSEPGQDMLAAVVRLWKLAPKKYAPLVPEKSWDTGSRYTVSKKGVKKNTLNYDIPEFDKEDARVSRIAGQQPDYVVSATKEFSSDAACLTYYRALLDRFSELLQPDGAIRSDHRDHVFFKQKSAAWERKLYVKHYVKQKAGRKPRVVVSVRVSFTE